MTPSMVNITSSPKHFPPPQGTREGYPYHGRTYYPPLRRSPIGDVTHPLAGATVHSRGTLYGYPGVGRSVAYIYKSRSSREPARKRQS